MAATCRAGRAYAGRDASQSVPGRGVVQRVVRARLVHRVLPDVAGSCDRHLPVHRPNSAAESADRGAVREFDCRASCRARVRDCRSASRAPAERDGRRLHRAQLPQDAQQKADFPTGPVVAAHLADAGPEQRVQQLVGLPEPSQEHLQVRVDESESVHCEGACSVSGWPLAGSQAVQPPV